MKDIYDLLVDGGKAIIGIPTDCPVMRQLIGEVYERELLYSFQHPWILNKRSFEICLKKAGFTKINIVYKQRYGISNMIAWLKYNKPKGHIRYDFISDSLDDLYKYELEKAGLLDYMVAYIEK